MATPETLCMDCGHDESNCICASLCGHKNLVDDCFECDLDFIRQRAADTKLLLRTWLIFRFYGFTDEHGQAWISEDGLSRLRELNSH